MSTDRHIGLPPEPTMADKIADAVYSTEKAIKDAILRLVKETGLCVTEINITHVLQSGAFGQEPINVQIRTKIKLLKDL